MSEWHIKEISDMTNTSIRMLRHYDKIGLLQPSYRSIKGYRCYTEKDLAKLQQIIALKYFGFNLKTIKTLLQKSQNIYAHLQAQQLVLMQETRHLHQVSDTIAHILKTLAPSETPNWNDLVTLIERYRMTEDIRDKLQQGWAGRALTEQQFEEYLFIYEQFPEEFAKRDSIIAKINNKEFGDPESKDGEDVAQFMHNLARKMKQLYSQQIKLGSSLMESIKSGKLTHFELSPEGISWLAQATLGYWLKRWDVIYNEIAINVESDPSGKIGKKIASEWIALTDDFLSVGCQPMMIGLMIWQELARQNYELKENSTMPSPQEMTKKFHIPLIFNPEAASWISKALEAHK